MTLCVNVSLLSHHDWYVKIGLYCIHEYTMPDWKSLVPGMNYKSDQHQISLELFLSNIMPGLLYSSMSFITILSYFDNWHCLPILWQAFVLKLQNLVAWLMDTSLSRQNPNKRIWFIILVFCWWKTKSKVAQTIYKCYM